MSDIKGCLVTVEGNYFALAGEKKKIKKPYKIQVKVASPEGALSLIKNKLLDKILTKQYPDYLTFHTHEITNVSDFSGNPLIGYSNVRLMNFNQIADYIRTKGLPLKLELYTELDTLRTMVYLAETNLQEFIRKQKILESEQRENSLLAELNPELFDSRHPIKVPVVTEVPEIEPVKKDQKKQMTWDDKKKKYVPIDEFEEDFERPEEAPYSEESLVNDL